MLKKRMFNKLLVGGVVVSILLWVQMPLLAQEKTLQEQLEEAKAAIADQTWVIEKLKDNFFETTKKLMEEINSLKAIKGEQAATIEQITNNFFKVTGELNSEVAALEEKLLSKPQPSSKSPTTSSR